MASGDGLVESLPAFLGTHDLWERAILLGYPLYADPNQQFFYPLAWLHLLPGTFNAFAVAPFVLAAGGMAGFVRALTRSAHAGVVAGLVYALGGFMISHAGHLMLSHPAAWAPFILWSVESMRRRTDGRPVVALATTLGLCGLAGQPQLLVFAATLAATYALVSGSGATDGAGKFYRRACAGFVLGFAIAAIQLLPEAALARDSTRASLSFDAFTAFQIPVQQLATRVVFPYLLGTSTLAWYPFSRVDLGTFTEETVAVGLVALALALLAVRCLPQERRIAFWYAVAVAALVLAVGDATPLASVTHRFPIYDLFRAPGRHAFEFSFAIAVLAGYGTAAVTRGRARAIHLSIAIGAIATLAVAAYAQFVGGSAATLTEIAAAYGVGAARVASPFANGALGVPLATGVLGCCLLWLAGLTRKAAAAGNLLIVAVAIDAGAFGWSAYWHWAAASEADLKAPPWVDSLAARARATQTRIAWLPGVLGRGMQPNLTTLWNVPVVGGYTPLVPRRTQELLDTTAAGGTTLPGIDDAGLDLAGAGIVATVAAANAAVNATQPFASSDVHAFIGPPNVARAARAAFGLPAPFAGTRVAMVSELGNAPSIPDDSTVAQLDITDIAGHRESHAIVAGRDTSEFAYDRADVRPLVRHRRAPIFSGDAMSHRYLSSFAVVTRLPIARVDVRWTYGDVAVGALTIEKLSIVNDPAGTAVAYGVLASFFAAPEHWRLVTVAPTIIAFENRRVMPRTWFGSTVASAEVAAVNALRGGLLPDGTHFDERRETLIEGDERNVPRLDGGGSARFLDDEPTHQTLLTSCAHACFLTLRDAFDPQWRVWIDGRPGTIVPADVALRGIALPSGNHRVLLAFAPTYLYAGAACTGVALLLTTIVLYRSKTGFGF